MGEEEAEVQDQQLLGQMLEAVRVTPALHEDLQVEVMKVRSAGSRLRLWHLPPQKKRPPKLKRNSGLLVQGQIAA